MCPECNTSGISQWAPFFANWPFSARCKNCGARLRVKIPHWQNVLVQVLGQIAFWGASLYGITAGWGGVIPGAIVGIIIALLIAMIPGCFAKLEVIKKAREGREGNEKNDD